MSFVKDLEMITPKDEPKMVNLEKEQSVPNMTFQDMKDYFDGLKESITSEMRKEMLEYIRNNEANSTDNSVEDNIKKEE